MAKIDTAPEIADIRRRVHEFIVANFLFGAGDVDDHASLLDEGVIDSMGVLEIVVFLEDELGVAVADDEVVPEVFDSIDAISAFAWERGA